MKKVLLAGCSIWALGVVITGLSGLPESSTEAEVQKNVTAMMKTVPDGPTPAASGLSEFCSFIEKNRLSYYALSQRKEIAKKQKNDLLAEQLDNQMTAVVHARNQEVFDTQKAKNFEINDWSMSIASIDTSFMTPEEVIVRMHPSCSPTTTISAYFDKTSDSTSFLLRKKAGDKVTINGRLVQYVKRNENTLESKAVVPFSPEEFETSFTASGSMEDAEYRTELTSIK
jgi:hypothetical protein